MRVRIYVINDDLQEPVLVAERENLEEAMLIVMSLVAVDKRTVIVEPVLTAVG